MRKRVVVFLIAILPINAVAHDTLLLYYYQRPPYLFRDAQHNVQGLVATPATRALQQAGIAFRWVDLSTNRQLQRLKSATEASCAVGWFRLAERESFARFSLPLYRDRATVVLTRSDVNVPNTISLTDLLQRIDLRLQLKAGYSYGPSIDDALRTATIQKQITTDEHDTMLQNILMQRSDVMLLTIEEAQWSIEHTLDSQKRLKIVRMSENHPGMARHLMRSHAVPSEWIQRIDHALLVLK